MSEILMFLRLAREVRAIIIEVGQLIENGRREDAAAIVLSRRIGEASGRAAHKASRNAGKR